MTARQVSPTLETEQAGVLNIGDEFKFQPDGFGTYWRVFTFHGHVIAPAGEWVDCFGGEPVDANYKHDRAWRSFDVDRIRKEAEPPAELATKGRRAA